jgi:transglutaminase-like putative cysteine protease
MSSLLSRLLDIFRPREGWIPYLLLLVALLSPTAATIENANNSEGFGMMTLTILAAIVGLRLARSSLSARGAALLGALLGTCLGLLIVGRLVPPFSLLWSDTGHAFEWFNAWQRGNLRWPLPFASSAQFVWQQLNGFFVRIWWWAHTLATGGQNRDNIVALLLVSILAWTLALFATWQIYRRRSALVALIPTGILTATIAFFRGGVATFYLIVYLTCTLWLVAICRLWTSKERWDEQNTDYPANLGTELLLSFGPLLTLLLVVAALFPVVYVHPVQDAFWRVMDAPWSRVEDATEQLFGPIDASIPHGRAYGPGSGGEMPRAHLLGGSPEMADTLVLYVSTNDPPPPLEEADTSTMGGPSSPYPRRYWRGETYDVYTGQGWINSRLESRNLSSGRILDRNPLPGSDLIQQVQRLSASDTRVYAVNAPYRVDIPVQAWWRDSGDLAFLTSESGVYTAISRPQEPTIAELRTSSPISASLPAEVAERYLTLPEDIPERVVDLARQVVGEASTRYDQARAIEAFLRTYPYNLELPDPPDDRDLVDYFLFDLQEGYCDYYASSMVVMARAMGVPARLASGYVQGTYDRDGRRWVVSEEDGHSWVEVYFEDWGWIEFEPTAGRPSLDRPGGHVGATPDIPSLPPRSPAWWQRVPWGLLVMGAVLLALVGLIVWIWRPGPALDDAGQAQVSASLVRNRQARLLRWGTRLGWPLRDGQTTHEYSRELGQALRRRGRGARLPQARRAAETAPCEVDDLSNAFIRAQYSPGPLPERDAHQVRDLWPRLRRRLWWLWLAAGSRKEHETDNSE